MSSRSPAMLVRRLPARPDEASRNRLDERYDELASSWSRRIARLGFVRAYRAVFRLLARRIAGRIGAAPDPVRVIDLGIGSGDAAQAIARGLAVVGRRAGVIGVDTSRGMLVEASRRLAADGIASTMHACDLRDLPIPDASCDVAIAAHSIEHLADPAPALAELDRVLAPGGTAVLIMTRCSVPTLTLEAAWPISCVRSDVLRRVLGERGYEVDLVTFPLAIVPNLLSFVCVARKTIASE